jgi:ligand-binding SRPBCC domain-containing protein
MFTISDSIFINAPIERCFLLSTSVELAGKTYGMKPLEGKTNGLLVADDKLLWAGWKFGLPQMHEICITRHERPSFFQETMGRGRFKRYQYDHYFYEMNDRTVLNDKIRFTMPLGFIGSFVGRFIIVPYLSKRMHRRLSLLRKVAQDSREWKKYLPEEIEPDRHPVNVS